MAYVFNYIYNNNNNMYLLNRKYIIITDTNGPLKK